MAALRAANDVRDAAAARVKAEQNAAGAAAAAATAVAPASDADAQRAAATPAARPKDYGKAPPPDSPAGPDSLALAVVDICPCAFVSAPLRP